MVGAGPTSARESYDLWN